LNQKYCLPKRFKKTK